MSIKSDALSNLRPDFLNDFRQLEKGNCTSNSIENDNEKKK